MCSDETQTSFYRCPPLSFTQPAAAAAPLHTPRVRVCMCVYLRRICTGGEPVEVQAGDMATFPAGMSCVWDVKEPIHKHYDFH